MRRWRWPEVALALAIAGLLVAGVWALWWDDVRRLLHVPPHEEATPHAPATSSQT